MRKTILLLIAVLTVSLVWIRRNPSSPMQGMGGAPADNPFTFRIVFGEKQEASRDYSGSVSLNAGRVLGVTGWRLFGGNAVEGNQGWKLVTKRIGFENQPDAPYPANMIGNSVPPQNFVPAGVTVTVEAPMTARAYVQTTQCSFDVPLADAHFDRVFSFCDGDVIVQRTPTPEQISQYPQGQNPQEHDYPSVAVTRSGVVWVTWQAYQDRGDNVYARYSTGPGWAEPVRLTEQKGDIFRSEVAEDAGGRIWVVWSERINDAWDLYARTFDGRSWSPRRKLTSGDGPNCFHRLIRHRSGTLHLIWIAHPDGQSHVMWSRLTDQGLSSPKEISGANAWMPEGAADSEGNLYIAWDSYRNGNYDVFLRKVGADGALDPIQQVTHSVKFQAQPTVAVDHQNRVWLAWDESGANWGKDWNRDDQWRSTTLYKDRRPRLAVLENGVWKEPADITSAVPRRYNRYIENPRLICDSQGRIWAVLQLRTATAVSRADIWALMGHWEDFLTSYEGDHWTPLMPIPQTDSRPDGPFAIATGPQGIWMAWVNNNREFGRSGGFQPPGAVRPGTGPHRPGVHEIDAASFATDAPVRAPVLEAFRDPTDAAMPVHPREPDDVARIRAYRTSLNGTTLRILRGDFHRHTEISGDGAGDGSVEDYFRYMMDAAAMDTGIISDHNAGGDNEYTWWRTEKAIDLYHVKGYFTPLFGYERSVPYPNGHRNVVFAERGTRTLPISAEEEKGQVNSGPILYPYLKQHRGICMLHSLATQQGTDYRDNDPEVEPLVEIYQGYHANYEYAGAPRAEGGDYWVNVHQGVRPLGFYWNALGKGYKLGIESSSDHISTHSSYTMIYTSSTERADIVESMRKRHAYSATDNIILDFKATDEQGQVHFMGEAFDATRPPKFSIKLMGTDKLMRVEIIKNGKFVYSSEPNSNDIEFTYVDNSPQTGESWYYVRAMQFDRNLAWSSPIWVKYRER
jgi:hypothetical protein